MACGCGKGKMARPASSGVSTVARAASGAAQSSNARVVQAASPYTRQQNSAPAHLQESLQRRTV